MKLLKNKVTAITLSVLLLCTVLSGTAFADTESDISQQTVGNYTYKFWCGTEQTTSGATTSIKGYAWVRESDDKHVPVGYMGLEARLYNEAGSLKQVSNTLYNDADYIGIGVSTGTETTKGLYYAQGHVKLWNGSKYTSWVTYKTPYDTLKTSYLEINPMLLSEYQINSAGETYGSALSAYTIGEEPDLIAAVGIDGTEGYVKNSELSTQYSSPAEAIAYGTDCRLIPLYDKEGSVIGQFLLNGTAL